MDTRDIIDRLEALLHLDVDAVRAYQQAIDEIEDPFILRALERFQDDHRQHIGHLSRCIRDLGAEPPAPRPDVKGFFIEGMTALRSKLGAESALKAMRMNEHLTNRRYEEALEQELTPAVRMVLLRHREDERRHLEFIEHALEHRLWEAGLEPPAA